MQAELIRQHLSEQWDAEWRGQDRVSGGRTNAGPSTNATSRWGTSRFQI